MENSPLGLQLSFWVLTILWHDQYVDCAVSPAVWPPGFRFAIWPMFVESWSKPANLSWNLALFHSDSTNIGQISNLDAGGERAVKTARSRYWSCHNMIRTQKLNYSQSGMNHKMELLSGSNLDKNPRFYVRSMSYPGTSYTVWFLGSSSPGLGPPVRLQPGLQPGNLELLLTLAVKQNGVWKAICCIRVKK